MRYDGGVKTGRVDMDEAQAEPSPAGERLPLGQWLIENMPRGTNLPIPNRRDSDRPIPFVDYDIPFDDYDEDGP